MLLLIITLLGCGGCTVKEQSADKETGKVESPKEDTAKDDTAEDTASK
jgi:hypothetical protein